MDLENIGLPVDGLVVHLQAICRGKFDSSPRCRQHYEALRAGGPGEVKACPFGFSSIAFTVGTHPFAITGFVPLPLSNGSEEKRLAKQYPSSRVTLKGARVAIDALLNARAILAASEQEVLKSHAMALHEIRKLNAKVKVTAERLCREDAGDDPEAARPEHLTVWKAAEMMSQQFLIIELLANETLADLPVKVVSEPYRAFDKCARILESETGLERKRIILRTSGNPNPKVRTCDKTFPIIPTVLLGNAMKYSIEGGRVNVLFDTDERMCRIRIVNHASPASCLDNRIFEKGFRASSDTDGSGYGLYVAQLVARQHGTRITLTSRALSEERTEVAFCLDLPLA